MSDFGAEEILLGEALYRCEAHLTVACELYGAGRKPDALLQAARPITDVLPWLETEVRSAGDALRSFYAATASVGAEIRKNSKPRALRRALKPFLAARADLEEATLGPIAQRVDYRASVAIALVRSAAGDYRRGVEQENLGGYHSAYALVQSARGLLEGSAELETLGSLLPAIEPPARLARPDDVDRLVDAIAAEAVADAGAKDAQWSLGDSLRKIDRLLADVLRAYEEGQGPLAARLASSLFVRSYDPIRRELATGDPDAEVRLTTLLGFELRTAINEDAPASRVRELATAAHELLVEKSSASQ